VLASAQDGIIPSLTVTREVSVAVVGAGYWGPNLVRNLTVCQETTPSWICDTDLPRAQKAAAPYPGIKVSADYRDVISSDCDAVAIATPVGTHYPLAKAALESGKHVLVEKPLAGTVAEGEELVRLAANRGLVLMCDHTFCYTGAVRTIREIVHSGELGEVLYFDSVRVNLGLFQSDVNVFWDLAPHDLSILDYVLTADLRPIAVAAQGVDAMQTGMVSVGHLFLFFERPVLAHLHANWLSPVKVRTTLLGGTKRMIVWDDNNPAERLKIYDKGVDMTGEDPNAVRVTYRHGSGFIPVLDGTEALMGVAREFAASIRERRSPATDGKAGLRVLRVLEAADRSLALGGRRVEL
jgi:predicted dehydrogenase